MNANELADYLQNKADMELNPRLQEAATMLRQQQAEIEALKLQNAKMQSELLMFNWNETLRLGRIG